MDFKKLAEQHLETALRRGYIEFEETGEVKHLTGAQVTSLSLAILKGGFLEQGKQESSPNMPSEMFSNPFTTKPFELPYAEVDEDKL